MLGPKGTDCVIPNRLERGTSASEDAGPEWEWIVRSHIGWREELSILHKGVKISSRLDLRVGYSTIRPTPLQGFVCSPLPFYTFLQELDVSS